MISTDKYFIVPTEPVEEPPKNTWEVCFCLYGGDADVVLQHIVRLEKDKLEDLEIILDFQREFVNNSHYMSHNWIELSEVLKPYVSDEQLLELELPQGTHLFDGFPLDPTVPDQGIYCSIDAIFVYYWGEDGVRRKTSITRAPF